MRDETTPDLSLLHPGSDEFKQVIACRDKLIADQSETNVIYLGGTPTPLYWNGLKIGDLANIEPPVVKPAKPQPPSTPAMPLRDRKKILARKRKGRN